MDIETKKVKVQYEYVIMGYYESYWEDIACEDTAKEGFERLKEYNENEPNILHMMVRRQVV